MDSLFSQASLWSSERGKDVTPISRVCHQPFIFQPFLCFPLVLLVRHGPWWKVVDVHQFRCSHPENDPLSGYFIPGRLIVTIAAVVTLWRCSLEQQRPTTAAVSLHLTSSLIRIKKKKKKATTCLITFQKLSCIDYKTNFMNVCCFEGSITVVLHHTSPATTHLHTHTRIHAHTRTHTLAQAHTEQHKNIE